MTKGHTEADLEHALEDLYQQWGRMGFWARRLHQRFSPGRARYVGGISAVRSVLRTKTVGLAFLRGHNRLDLSVEHLTLKAEWKDLFCDEDREMARKRLDRK